MTRYHALDWLRVLLFALLVPHHVAVGFVGFGAEIYGFVNDRLAGDGLSLFVFWSHSWRLPSLFLIAGIGTWFLTSKGAGLSYIGTRMLRLLVPALFGFVVLNVFAGYATALVQGDPRGFFPFWWDWLTKPVLYQILHLWFLLSLAAYTVIAWPVTWARDWFAANTFDPRALLAALVAASALCVVLFKPMAPALVGDSDQFPYYLVFFLGGYLIGANSASVLAWTGRWVWALLGLACLVFLAKTVLLTIALVEDEAVGAVLASGGWRPLGLAPPNATLYSVVEAMTAWAWCLTAVGLAVRFLSKPSPRLAALNRAVFPVYVLHFPVTIILLALATLVPAPWGIEFLVVTVLVYGLTWGLWRAADRLGSAAYLIGAKPQAAARS